ncbi:MAG TPA: F0F1 ATP synthase subunit alpha, partial [Chloroflexota bacterium]|nr:F0F1 ATP synthase subunit alpha [Chloroflexota bacterium]
MAVRGEEISSILRQQIQGFDEAVTAQNVGTVIEVGDGIARIWGLSNAMANELLEFPKSGVRGLALNLEEDTVGCVVLGPYTDIAEGDEVVSTG